MKKYLAILIMAGTTIAGCTKQPPSAGSNGVNQKYLGLVKSYLIDSMKVEAYKFLDFTHVAISTTDTGKTFIVRIPDISGSVARKFVLVGTDSFFSPAIGCQIEISQDTSIGNLYQFNGSIKKRWLNGKLDYESTVQNGYILALHKTKVQDEAEKAVELPEVIIYAPDYDYYADWEYIVGSVSGNNGGYSSSTPSGGGGASGGAQAAVNTPSFDFANELQASRPGINIAAFLKCFSLVPDQGATYTASLLVRIPNPSNPNIMWNVLTGNVGHTFVQLTKTNGTTTVTQIIGFYAACGMCAVTGRYTPSKIVDNSGHPFDASLTANLTAGQFSDLTTELQLNSQLDYALGLYNCTNFAVDAFNEILPSPIDVPDMTIPGQSAGMTPNGLYIALGQTPAADGQVNKYASDQTSGSSHGACN